MPTRLVGKFVAAFPRERHGTPYPYDPSRLPASPSSRLAVFPSSGPRSGVDTQPAPATPRRNRADPVACPEIDAP